MANRYCIASGDYTSTAIWSTTGDQGDGGASVPLDTDMVYFNRSVTVTNLPRSPNKIPAFSTGGGQIIQLVFGDQAISFSNDISVGIGSELRLRPYNQAGHLSVSVYGKLLIRASAKAVTDVAKQYQGYFRFLTGGSLDNSGTLESVNKANEFTGQETQVTHYLGTCTGVYIQQYRNVATSIRLTGRSTPQLGRMVIGQTHATPGPMIVDLLVAMNVTGDLEVVKRTNLTDITVNQYGDLTVAGDVLPPATGDVAWNAYEGSLRYLSGTADQTVGMTPGLSAVGWTANKPAGELDLTAYDGSLQGRVRKLTVRAGSNVSLTGPSPVLPTSAGPATEYRGLKADVVNTSGDLTYEEILQEAMDACDNYGTIDIPDEKVLCAQAFTNHPGGTVTGSGILRIAYGSVVPEGSVAETVDVQYFGTPIDAVLDAPPIAYTGTPYIVDTTGSLGSLFRVEWGDGLVTETTTPGVLPHVYLSELGELSITLTVKNADGWQATATANVTVSAEPVVPKAQISVTPWHGTGPLTVAVSASGSIGDEMQLDWDDGTGYGPGPVEEVLTHEYVTTGEYVITLRVRYQNGDWDDVQWPVLVFRDEMPVYHNNNIVNLLDVMVF